MAAPGVQGDRARESRIVLFAAGRRYVSIDAGATQPSAGLNLTQSQDDGAWEIGLRRVATQFTWYLQFLLHAWVDAWRQTICVIDVARVPRLFTIERARIDALIWLKHDCCPLVWLVFTLASRAGLLREAARLRVDANVL